MTIYARVKSVNMEKFSVDMTCRSSDLEDKEGRFGWVSYQAAPQSLTRWRETGLECLCSSILQRSQGHLLRSRSGWRGPEKGRSRLQETSTKWAPVCPCTLMWWMMIVLVCVGLVKRVITHPSFQNINFDETVKLLSTMDQGEAIFRPSSKVRVCVCVCVWGMRGMSSHWV